MCKTKKMHTVYVYAYVFEHRPTKNALHGFHVFDCLVYLHLDVQNRSPQSSAMTVDHFPG